MDYTYIESSLQTIPVAMSGKFSGCREQPVFNRYAYNWNVNKLDYIPHLSNPAIWLVEIAFINFNCSCKIPGNHA